MLTVPQILLWAWALPIVLFFLLMLWPAMFQSLKNLSVKLADDGESVRLTPDQWLACLLVMAILWPLVVSWNLLNIRDVYASARRYDAKTMKKEKAKERLKDAFKK